MHTEETYCPCCASDNTAHQETNHSNGTLTETFKCDFCQSSFDNVYHLDNQLVTEDNSDTMHMLKAKEVIEEELKALGDNISNSQGFTNGRIYMLLDCLKNELNEWDSKDLAETYRESSFHATYEQTKDHEAKD